MERGDDKEKPTAKLELERYKVNEAHIVELVRATIAFEHAALKPLPLLNGGAIVGVLTFIGHAMETQSAPHLSLAGIRWALVAWTIGLVAYAIGIFCGYFSQRFFMKAARRKRDADEANRVNDAKGESDARCEWRIANARGTGWGIAAYVSACASLICFIVGAFFGIFSFPA